MVIKRREQLFYYIDSIYGWKEQTSCKFGVSKAYSFSQLHDMYYTTAIDYPRKMMLQACFIKGTYFGQFNMKISNIFQCHNQITTITMISLGPSF
jgi:hypothetical protein